MILSPLRAAYKDRLASGDLKPDLGQEQAVAILEGLAARLDGYKASSRRSSRRFWNRLLSSPSLPHPYGLYLHGDVGRGKSMLMDLFFATVPVAQKRRVHFHAFMLEIHERLHQLQKNHKGEILPRLARALAAQTTLLCFDEFHVSNIADAMILGRLFEALFEEGVVIVATSNSSPDALYTNGLQRERFLPFIDLLQQRLVIHALSGAVDYRYEPMRGVQTCFSPLGDKATHRLQSLFLQLTDEAAPEPVEIPVQGRVLRLTHTAKGVGFFNFDELCVEALGAADYLALAGVLHTVLLDNVPKLDAEKRNETVRFMTLIDVLYEAKVQFFMAAALPPEKLTLSGPYEIAFQRTISRLMEMQGDTYRRREQ